MKNQGIGKEVEENKFASFCFSDCWGLAPALTSLCQIPYYMKTTLLNIISLLAATSLVSGSLIAQSTIEFSSASGPSTSGSTTANQVITFQNNANNPSGNTFTAFVPTTKATFSISNQQYILPTSQNSNKADVSFGGTISPNDQSINSNNQFTNMGAIGSASNSNFTSSATEGTTGTGLSTSSNYGVEIFTSAMGLYNAGVSTSGRYYMADLTISFDHAITNPVIHVAGLGGTFGPGGFSVLGLTSELELQTSGVTLSKLSGSGELSVTSTKILNNDNHPGSTTGSGAASGSILATGNKITSLTFKIYMRGDGVVSTWSNSTQHTGDAFIVSVTALSTQVTLPVTISSFTARAEAHTTQLDWTTALEQNSGHFIVEYSRDGQSWETIGQVQAAGNSSIVKEYTFTHLSPVTGNNYYRLQEVDLDGKASYSSVREVSFAQPSTFSCFPNPTVDRVTVITGITNTVSVALMTLDGKAIQIVPQFTSGGSFDLSRYPSGMYLLVIRHQDGRTETLKVQKN